MKDIRQQEIDRLESTSVRRPCEVTNCLYRAVDGKTYCLNHIEKMPYAAKISAEVDARASERQTLAKGHSLPEDAYLLADAIKVLSRMGAVSVPRLGRELRLTEKGVVTLVQQLASAKLVNLKKGGRDFIVEGFNV